MTPEVKHNLAEVKEESIAPS